MKKTRFIWIALLLAALAGCHHWRTTELCHAPQTYQKAAQMQALKVPAGLDAPNTASSLQIPALEGAIPTRGLKDPCLESPPKFKPGASNKAGTQS